MKNDDPLPILKRVLAVVVVYIVVELQKLLVIDDDL